MLENTARSGLGLLNDLAATFFGCKEEGGIRPEHPEYWEAVEEGTPALVAEGSS